MTLLKYASPHQPFLGYQSSNVLGHKPQLFLRSRTRRAVITERSSSSTSGRELEDRIREQLVNAELSPSSYDTAWAAMVPAPGSPQASRFPTVRGLDPAEPAQRRLLGAGLPRRRRGPRARQGRGLVHVGVRPRAQDVGRRGGARRERFV